MILLLETVKKGGGIIYYNRFSNYSQGLDFTIPSVRSHLNRPFKDSFKMQDRDNNCKQYSFNLNKILTAYRKAFKLEFENWKKSVEGHTENSLEAKCHCVG